MLRRENYCFAHDARLFYALLFSQDFRNIPRCTVSRVRLKAILMFAAVAFALLACFVSTAQAQQFPENLYQEMRWRMIGPGRGGRTVAVAGVPSQPNVYYFGTVDGGVWKSTDYGRTWNPIFDAEPTGSVGAVAVAPSDPNIIYIGSGEGLQRPDLSVGNGIYKSTDAGATWTHLGLNDAQQIPSIIVDPHDPNRVFVAVLGHPYGPNEMRGVFRSIDGGETWQKVFYKDENTGAVQVAFDPSNSKIVYAVLWAARQGPWEYGNAYLGEGSGLYKSTDGGDNWKPIGRGLPIFAHAQGLGRIGIGIAPSKPSRIYALVQALPRFGGVYRSDDAGATFKRVNSQPRVYGRGDDFAGITVDPKNPDIVYSANTSTYKSTDGGTNFTPWKGAPGGDDYHTVWINPENPQIIFLGVDQGATLTVNGGATWSSWYNQPTAQFYHVITDNRFPYWVYGGQQESGSIGIASRGNDGEITFREWHPVGAEEYAYIAPDPLNPDIIYGAGTNDVTKFDWATGQVQKVSPIPMRSEQYRVDRTQPLIFSPADPHILYYGANVLFKTTNGGQSWQTISPDLAREHDGVPPTLGGLAKEDPRAALQRGVIYSIGPSPRDVNVIWAGTDDGYIWMTRDGGKNWRNVTPPALTPWSKITQIVASHYDSNTAFASVSRFRIDDLKPYIYRTDDGGVHWQLITDGLPDNAPVDTVREDPVRKNLLFAGTENAVWVSFDAGDHWQSLQLNLPHTAMRDLWIQDNDLVVGTHGRSFWILDDITPLRQLSDAVAKSDAYLFEPEPAYRLRRDTNTDTPLPPEVPAGQNPPDGAILDYYLASASSGLVTLSIYDRSGKLVRSYSSAQKPDVTEQELQKTLTVPIYWVGFPKILSAAAGMHRFVWDLHYTAPESLAHEYPISAIFHDTPRLPLGPRALPGEYTAKLVAGGHTYSQGLSLKMDPRVHATPGALAEMFGMEQELAAAMNETYDALDQIKKFGDGLKNQIASATPTDAQKLKQLDEQAAALAGAGGGRGPFGAAGGADNFARLHGEVAQLYGLVDSADAAPTAAQVAAWRDLKPRLDALLAKWKEIQQSSGAK
jgi:photosystem II stability/assembly factor-like uncharacterized protein